MSELPEIPTWINGQSATSLPVSDRGLAYGDGLFETIRIAASGPVLLEYHLQRLFAGVRRLNIACDLAQLKSELLTYPGLQTQGITKLILTRGSGGRGYSPHGALTPTCILQHFPLPEYPAQWFEEGIALFPCSTRLGMNPQLAGLKHLNRLEQVLARAEWTDHDDFQEGLVCDSAGHPVEGVMSNWFIVKDNQVFTPDLSQCGVAGVMRRWLMEQLRTRGYAVRETTITMASFQVADECFFCNSVYGVWPVARYETIRWSPGPVGRLAQQLIKSNLF